MLRTWYITSDWRTCIDRNNYTIEPMEQGDVVSRVFIEGKPKIEKIQNSSSKIPYALCLMNVVGSRFGKNGFINYCSGDRVDVLERGEIIYDLDNLNLPVNQPVYVDIDNSRLSWKATGPKAGVLVSPQDTDGFCKIFIDFTKQFE